MKVAVSGATGFIGRHVVAELDRRSIPTTTLCRADIDLKNPPADAFDAIGRPDTLIHLAWSGLPHYDSLHHFETELPAQYAFLKQLIEEGLRNLVVTGTCFEYGDQSGSLSEDIEARPTNPYGFAKDALRRQLEYLRGKTPFQLTWARLFYLYGEGQSPSSLWPQLKAAVARGDRAFGMSGGEQLRDYLPVARAAKSLVSLAVSGQHHGTVNVCAGAPVSVRELVTGWIEQNGWSIALDLGRYPYSGFEPMAFWGDARKLARLLHEDESAG